MVVPPPPIKIKSAVTVIHPDFSHSLLPFVAVNEPELEGACRTEEAGSAVVGKARSRSRAEAEGTERMS